MKLRSLVWEWDLTNSTITIASYIQAPCSWQFEFLCKQVKPGNLRMVWICLFSSEYSLENMQFLALNAGYLIYIYTTSFTEMIVGQCRPTCRLPWKYRKNVEFRAIHSSGSYLAANFQTKGLPSKCWSSFKLSNFLKSWILYSALFLILATYTAWLQPFEIV